MCGWVSGWMSEWVGGYVGWKSEPAARPTYYNSACPAPHIGHLLTRPTVSPQCKNLHIVASPQPDPQKLGPQPALQFGLHNLFQSD